jgi:hypothetical protein
MTSKKCAESQSSRNQQIKKTKLQYLTQNATSSQPESGLRMMKQSPHNPKRLDFD